MKCRGTAVNMSALGPKNKNTNPHLAKVCNDVIFFLGVFMIQFNLIYLNLIEKTFQLYICCAQFNVKYV